MKRRPRGRREKNQSVAVAGGGRGRGGGGVGRGWGGGGEDLSHMERLCHLIWNQNFTATIMIYVPSYFTSLPTK